MSDRSRDDTAEDRSDFVFGGARTGTEDDDRDGDRSDRLNRASRTDDRRDFLDSDRRTTVATVIVAVGLVLATASIGYAVNASDSIPGESSTAFALLTENGDGELVAGGYPTNFTRNESRPVVIAVTNERREPTNYTVAVELQRVRSGSDGATRVLDERELQRFGVSVPTNETQYVTYNATPTVSGENLRLAFFLYRGGAPADPTAASAYRELHLTVNVTTSASSGRARSTG